MTFAVKMDPEDGRCDLGLTMDAETVVIDEGTLELNDKWDDPLCDKADDLALDLEQFVLDVVMQDLLRIMVDLLEQQLGETLQSLDLSAFGLTQIMVLCHRNITVLSDVLIADFDLLFGNNTLSELGVDDDIADALRVGGISIDDTDLSEIGIIFVFGLSASFVGCACNLCLLIKLKVVDGDSLCTKNESKESKEDTNKETTN